MIELTPLAKALSGERFGGKAVGLARLINAGLPVPCGFAVDPDGLRALATNATDVWGQAQAHAPLWALRSSALDEDSKAASFAGQHESVLGIASDAALGSAARKVLESGSASRAYRSARGLSGDTVLAAVLQRVVEPVASGVLFSRDPISGSECVVVEASWGFGEAIVQGLVEPDRFFMRQDGSLLEAHVGDKDIRIGLRGEEAVPPQDRERRCLPPEALAGLVKHLKACEAVAEGPADVEWAWDGMQLWFLQCRAITA